MTHNIGEHYSNLGRLEAAEVAQADARRVWTAARYTLGAASATSGLGRTFARMGRDDEAMPLLEEALDHVREPGSRDRGGGDRGPHRRSPPAGRAVGRGAPRSPRSRSPESTVPSTRSTSRRCKRGRGQALLALGDVDGARIALDASREVARAAELEFELACTLVVQALVEDDPFEAEADRDAARIIFDVLGATPTWLPASSPEPGRERVLLDGPLRLGLVQPARDPGEERPRRTRATRRRSS